MGFLSDIGDFLSDPLDIINTGGDLSPRGLLEQITDPTKSEREGALRQQEAAGNEAIQLQRDALDQIRADLAPFRDAGAPAANLLLQTAQQDINPLSAQELTSDPFFTSLAKDQEQRLLRQQASLGRVGSGETKDILNRNLLLLGNQFRQQDLQNQLGQQNQLFGQLFNTSTLGQNAAAQTGTAAQNTAGNIGGYLTQIANANAANNMAQGQADSAFTGQLLGGGIGAALGALPGGGGAGAGALLGFLCDRRSKENIQEVCTDDDGLKIYSFNYIGDDKKYIGKMAQEIIEIDPDSCVINDEGYYLVSEKYAPTEVA